jgi:hypothetical protein
MSAPSSGFWNILKIPGFVPFIAFTAEATG